MENKKENKLTEHELIKRLDNEFNDLDFEIKECIRFKPLEYLCEDLTTETLEEIK